MEEKYYIINAISEDAFDTIHEYLTTSTSTISNVPNREVICENYTLQSPTRGTYLLTDEEKADLENRPEIEYINIDVAKYPEMQIPSDQLQCDIPPKKNRYANNIRNYFYYFTNYNGLANNDNGAATSQLLRMRQKAHPWAGQDRADVINDIPTQRGTGKGVDVIVGDNGSWIGHPEFMNETFHTGSLNNGEAGIVPQDFIPGNVLSKRDGRDALNATAPLCNVLDLVLDGPYYIDPDYFNADAANRLETRWDGTIVPVESVARSWWGNGSNR